MEVRLLEPFITPRLYGFFVFFFALKLREQNSYGSSRVGIMRWKADISISIQNHIKKESEKKEKNMLLQAKKDNTNI